jgi:hypothetical protein
VGRAVVTEVLDPTPPGPAARLGPIRLTTVDEIRVEMAKVYREARRGKLPTEEATRLVYVLTQIVKAHEVAVIERRIEALENLSTPQ